MKTRREFFKVFAGSCAVLAACIVAPKSLMAAPEPEGILAHWTSVNGVQVPDVVTSGYAQVEQSTWTAYYDSKKRLDNIDSWIRVEQLDKKTGVSMQRRDPKAVDSITVTVRNR